MAETQSYKDKTAGLENPSSAVKKHRTSNQNRERRFFTVKERRLPLSSAETSERTKIY